jgi:PAS domain S-box-containing protein
MDASPQGTIPVDRLCLPLAPPILTVTLLLLAVVPAAVADTPAPPGPVLIRASGGDSYAPYHYVDDDGEASGFDVELLLAVMRAIGRRVEIRLDQWQRARAALSDGEIDMVVGLTKSPERTRELDFTEPILTINYRTFVRAGSPDISRSDLDDKQIIVQRASLMEELARSHSWQPMLVDSGSQGMQLLASGQYDCYLGSEYRVLYLARELGLEGLKRVGEPLQSADYGFAVRKGNTDLVDQLNRGLDLVRASGEYDEIYQRWFISLEPGLTSRRVLTAATAIVLPLLAVLLISVLWSWTLRRKVVARTGELRQELARRQEVETALRESEERFSKAFRHSPEPIVILTLPDDQILEVNQAFEVLTGYSRQELIGKDATEIGIWNSPEMDSYQSAAQNVEESRPILNLEMHIRHRSGESRFCLCSMSRIEVSSQPCLLLVTADITEHRHLEEQLAQASKMEALGQLAGGVAHDFNNLLTAIQGFAELTLMELDNSHPQRRWVTSILESARQGSELTTKMLAFSRRQALNPVAMDLNNVVRRTEPLLRRLIGDRIDLLYHLDEDLKPVKVDPGQISQVIINLAVNARDAMPNGGSINIRTSQQERPTSGAGDQVFSALEIEDTGIGVIPAHLPHIFEPFFTTKPEGKGTGLGLSTVYGIVKQSCGQIEVDSQPGGGTRFTVLLPPTDLTTETAGEEYALDQTPKGNETILVVEDDLRVCELIREVLVARGYKVVTASHPVTAMRIFTELDGEVDLLLTDVGMPEMTGIELAARIHELRDQVKVLYISGNLGDPYVQDNLIAKDADLLAKPFTYAALAGKVREVLDQVTAVKTSFTDSH